MRILKSIVAYWRQLRTIVVQVNIRPMAQFVNGVGLVDVSGFRNDFCEKNSGI